MDQSRPDSAPPPSTDAPLVLPLRGDRGQDIPPTLAPQETPTLDSNSTYHIFSDPNGLPPSDGPVRPVAVLHATSSGGGSAGHTHFWIVEAMDDRVGNETLNAICKCGAVRTFIKFQHRDWGGRLD